MVLRASYGKCGTDIGYDATRDARAALVKAQQRAQQCDHAADAFRRPLSPRDPHTDNTTLITG
eukprot:2443119-Rhodomonas_salina.1